MLQLLHGFAENISDILLPYGNSNLQTTVFGTNFINKGFRTASALKTKLHAKLVPSPKIHRFIYCLLHDSYRDVNGQPLKSKFNWGRFS